MDNFEEIRAALQQHVDAAVQCGGGLTGLTDQAVAESIIRDYFRAQAATDRRHMVDVGAAYGAIADVFLRDGWTADLFEPDPACGPQLERLLAKHAPRARLFAHAVALSARASVNFHQNTIAGLSGLTRSPFGGARTAMMRWFSSTATTAISAATTGPIAWSRCMLKARACHRPAMPLATCCFTAMATPVFSTRLRKPFTR